MTVLSDLRLINSYCVSLWSLNVTSAKEFVILQYEHKIGMRKDLFRTLISRLRPQSVMSRRRSRANSGNNAIPCQIESSPKYGRNLN